MTEAGADMFTFHVCVVVGGSNDRSWGLTCLRSMFVL